MSPLSPHVNTSHGGFCCFLWPCWSVVAQNKGGLWRSGISPVLPNYVYDFNMTRYLLNIFRICPTYSAIFIHVWDLTWDEKKGLTIYHIPKIMVPVRTWQQRQQLVEYHRSHGEIIFLSTHWISGYFMNAVENNWLVKATITEKRWER